MKLFAGHRNPPLEKKHYTIDEILDKKYIDCASLITLVNGEKFDELEHSINKEYFKLTFIGTFNLFDKWINQIGNNHKIEIYSTEIKQSIRDLGNCSLLDVCIVSPDNKALKIILTWRL